MIGRWAMERAEEGGWWRELYVESELFLCSQAGITYYGGGFYLYIYLHCICIKLMRYFTNYRGTFLSVIRFYLCLMYKNIKFILKEGTCICHEFWLFIITDVLDTNVFICILTYYKTHKMRLFVFPKSFPYEKKFVD